MTTTTHQGYEYRSATDAYLRTMLDYVGLTERTIDSEIDTAEYAVETTVVIERIVKSVGQ